GAHLGRVAQAARLLMWRREARRATGRLGESPSTRAGLCNRISAQPGAIVQMTHARRSTPQARCARVTHPAEHGPAATENDLGPDNAQCAASHEEVRMRSRIAAVVVVVVCGCGEADRSEEPPLAIAREALTPAQRHGRDVWFKSTFGGERFFS